MRAEVVNRWKKEWGAGDRTRTWRQKNGGGRKDEPG